MTMFTPAAWLAEPDAGSTVIPIPEEAQCDITGDIPTSLLRLAGITSPDESARGCRGAGVFLAGLDTARDLTPAGYGHGPLRGARMRRRRVTGALHRRFELFPHWRPPLPVECYVADTVDALWGLACYCAAPGLLVAWQQPSSTSTPPQPTPGAFPRNEPSRPRRLGRLPRVSRGGLLRLDVIAHRFIHRAWFAAARRGPCPAQSAS
jgi:hypothetical protein